MEIFGVYLGLRLGLYAALAEGGAATPGQLAAWAGVDARYAREWLEQQAVAGILQVDDPALPADLRRPGPGPHGRPAVGSGLHPPLRPLPHLYRLWARLRPRARPLPSLPRHPLHTYRSQRAIAGHGDADLPPGDWLTVAPTAEVGMEHFWALCKCYSRAWGKLTDPRRMAVYSAKYGTGSAKDYQHRVPAEWLNS
ncbi:MAG: hypothetical protein M3N52_02330 [Actinomycetota bacterium]|nr:hypothetical protein [Actinomycetota bacterium]